MFNKILQLIETKLRVSALAKERKIVNDFFRNCTKQKNTSTYLYTFKFCRFALCNGLAFFLVLSRTYIFKLLGKQRAKIKLNLFSIWQGLDGGCVWKKRCVRGSFSVNQVPMFHIFIQMAVHFK